MNDNLTKKETAEFLRCTPRTIDNYLSNGQLTGWRVGRKWLFKMTELEKLSKPKKK